MPETLGSPTSVTITSTGCAASAASARRRVEGLQHHVARHAQQLGQRLADELVVLDQQHRAAARGAAGGVARRRHGRRHALDVGQHALLFLVRQHVADLARERLARVGLGQQLHAAVQPSAVHDRVLGVARREQHGQARQPLLGLARQLGAAQRAGHHDVGEQHVDGHAALDDAQRAHRLARLQHAVAEVGQQAHGGLAHLVVVLHHQHRLACRRAPAPRSRRPARPRPGARAAGRA